MVSVGSWDGTDLLRRCVRCGEHTHRFHCGRHTTLQNKRGLRSVGQLISQGEGGLQNKEVLYDSSYISFMRQRGAMPSPPWPRHWTAGETKPLGWLAGNLSTQFDEIHHLYRKQKAERVKKSLWRSTQRPSNEFGTLTVGMPEAYQGHILGGEKNLSSI